MTSEQAALAALTHLRITERHYEAINEMTGRKWRTPMRLLTDERNVK